MKIINWLKENYWLTIILALAAFLRFYHADVQSIWADEILSMTDADPSLTLKQVNSKVLFWEYLPQLYFFLLHFVFEIFGFTTLVGRLFSGVIGIFGVYAIYLLGREMFNKNVGLIAALFLSVNYFHICHSQEIRPYGLLFLFSVLSFYRLFIFLRNSTRRNAIYYGIFTGLILHGHFFGFITIFAQCVVLLFFLIKTPAEARRQFLTYCLTAGATVLVIVAPAYKAIERMFGIKSFWLAAPTENVYTEMFREFFGKSEMVLFAVNLIILFFVFSVFTRKKTETFENFKTDKLLLCAFVLCTWLIFSLFIPLLKSYLDISMIISRYFISVVAILVLVLAIGTELLENKIVKTIVVSYFVVFSVVDLFVVRKYYTAVSKTQFRELTDRIRKSNTKKAKIVTYWAWLFPHFYTDDPEIRVENATLDDYVLSMERGSASQVPFWYADANSRPYHVTPQTQSYLDKNFRQVKSLEVFDAWARYYTPINPQQGLPTELKLGMFNAQSFDPQGNLIFFSDGEISATPIMLESGNYELAIQGKSTPEKPINGENAHFVVKVNNKQIGQFNLSEKDNAPENVFRFVADGKSPVKVSIRFDNDYSADGLDRNAFIYAIAIRKK